MILPYAVSGGVAIFLGAAGGLLTTIGPWYRALRKPTLQPPDWLFGPAWTIILALAAYSAGLAWNSTTDPAMHARIVILFGINAICHLLWSPLFFKFRRPDWALVEVVFLWASLVALVIGLMPISRTASLMILPYLAWVSFATWLNYMILRLNGPFSAARQT